jgi:hypothetical protein
MSCQDYHAQLLVSNHWSVLPLTAALCRRVKVDKYLHTVQYCKFHNGTLQLLGKFILMFPT